MAVTVTDARTTPDEADSTTGWSSPVAGEALTVYTTDPAPVESTGSIGMAVSIQTSDLVYGIASTDLSNTLIYVWALANGTMDTLVNGGVAILLGDGTNLVGYHLAGSDATAFRHESGPVGWQCMVLDTSNLPTNKTQLLGTVDPTLTAITQIGAMYKTLSKALGGTENCFTDVIRYGNGGLKITGGTSLDTGKFSEIAADDRSSTSGKAYGIIRELGTGLYGVQGPLTFGDTAGVSATYFADTNATVVFEDRSLGTDKYSITVQGNATGSTTFQLGTKVGTTGGTDGCSLTCPSGVGASFTANDADLQYLKIYGSIFSGFNNGVNFSSDATNGPNHEVFDCTFAGCGLIDPGRVDFKNNSISSSTATAALLWNANINIADCSFTNNTNAVKHTAAGTFTYDNLTFSANSYDVENSANATTADSYTEANQDSTQALGNGTIVGVAQSFTNATSGTLSNARFYLSKTLSPTGNATAKLYAINNAIGGGDDIPTGTALATSETVDVSTLTGTLTLTQFPFTDEYTMAASTDYVIALEYSGGDASNYVNVGTDTSSPTHTGNFATLTGSTWSAVSGTDAIFYVSRDGVVVINATNGSNPGTFTATGSPPGTVVINNAVTLEVNGVSKGARCYIEVTGGGDTVGKVLMSKNADTLVTATGKYKATQAYNYPGSTVNVLVRVRLVGFLPFETTGEVTANGLTITAVWQEDPISDKTASS